MQEGDTVYHKLDSRPMIVVDVVRKPVDGSTGMVGMIVEPIHFSCRYVSQQHKDYVVAVFHKNEISLNQY